MPIAPASVRQDMEKYIEIRSSIQPHSVATASLRSCNRDDHVLLDKIAEASEKKVSTYCRNSKNLLASITGAERRSWTGLMLEWNSRRTKLAMTSRRIYSQTNTDLRHLHQFESAASRATTGNLLRATDKFLNALEDSIKRLQKPLSKRSSCVS